MGRREYLDDLTTAQSIQFENVSSVFSSDDGELTFNFGLEGVKPAQITALIPDVSEYPESHDYVLFASEDAPVSVAQAIESVPKLRRKTIPQLIETLSEHLAGAAIRTNQKGPRSIVIIDDDNDVRMSDAEDEDDYSDWNDEGDNEDWGFEDIDFDNMADPRPSKRNFSGESRGSVSDRLKNDFRAVREAGFKIGALGDLTSGAPCFVCVSVRIEKLGISDEAMLAWSLHSSNYLCLLLNYPAGYRSFRELTAIDQSQVNQYVRFRVGTCKSYKPSTYDDARAFFNASLAKYENTEASTKPLQLSNTFISQPINKLLNDRLLALINLRLSEDISWWGAEDYYQDLMGKRSQGKKASSPRKEYRQADPVRAVYPRLVVDDEIASSKKTSTLSFPLIAMQFMLRHFVRCPEFCLACHMKIDSNLESIKPYVCDKPLCLFQYMNLGFGPSIEHEVQSQPFVVDLLVSFCYAACMSGKLRSYPTGLEWQVPHPKNVKKELQEKVWGMEQNRRGYPSPPPCSDLKAPRRYRSRVNLQRTELLFESNSQCSLKKGDWIVVDIVGEDSQSFHAQVTEILLPSVKLSGPVVPAFKKKTQSPEKHKKKKPGENWQAVEYCIYEINFDALSNQDKANMMLLLMNLIPSVTEMKDYLKQENNRSLAGWRSRVSPATMGLFRWIIASNRSCIMQVDNEASDFNPKTPLGLKPGEQRIGGIKGWLQFRFAMGAPDKEKRFHRCLSKGNQEYPSLFAWHGSPLYNWHGIVREGLNFQEVQHGRAYGNGCYHARDWMTSASYTSMGPRGVELNSFQAAWPSSVLDINSVIALNEIVNAPYKFVSAAPFYVVQHIDWIQTRYLFVQPTRSVQTAPDVTMEAKDTLRQDPCNTPSGPSGAIVLPVTALPKNRRGGKSHNSPTGKSSPSLSNNGEPGKEKGKQKLTAGNLATLAGGDRGTRDNPIDVDAETVSTLSEDLQLVLDSTCFQPPTTRPNVPQIPVTPFKPQPIPNAPTLPPPSFATPKATKTLQKSYLDLIKTQDAHTARDALHELGWYLDESHMEHTNNIYQWLICMHSFPLDLPLGQDMRAANIDAIVFELRFSANFPFSPPFVRVVRPRFLPFNMGGGGHVTLGGSVCMDLLTSSGWSAAMSIESVLLQVRLALLSSDPRPARLDCVAGRGGFGTMGIGGRGGAAMDYDVGEAVEAYIRACRMHGWQVPEDLLVVAGSG